MQQPKNDKCTRALISFMTRIDKGQWKEIINALSTADAFPTRSEFALLFYSHIKPETNPVECVYTSLLLYDRLTLFEQTFEAFSTSLRQFLSEKDNFNDPHVPAVLPFETRAKCLFGSRMNFCNYPFLFDDKSNLMKLVLWEEKSNSLHLWGGPKAMKKELKNFTSVKPKNQIPAEPYTLMCFVPHSSRIAFYQSSILYIIHCTKMEIEKTLPIKLSDVICMTSLSSKHFVIAHEHRCVSFFSCLSEVRLINSLCVEGGHVSKLRTISKTQLAFIDNYGNFYMAHKCSIRRVYLVIRCFQPLQGWLVKNFLVIASREELLFWGFGSDIRLFHTWQKVDQGQRIIIHSAEVGNVSYISEQHRFVSFDSQNWIVVWSAATFIRQQTIRMKYRISDLFVPHTGYAIYCATGTGIQVIAKGPRVPEGQLLSASYNSQYHVLLVATMKHTRYVDIRTGKTITYGGMHRISIGDDSKMCDEKGVSSLFCSAEKWILALADHRGQLEICDAATRRPVKGYWSKTGKVGIVSVMRYFVHLSSLAIGYQSSEVELYRSEMDTWTRIRELLASGKEAPVTALGGWGTLLVIGAEDGTLALWELGKGVGAAISWKFDSAISAVEMLGPNNFISCGRKGIAVLFESAGENIFIAKHQIRPPRHHGYCCLAFSGQIHLGVSDGSLLSIEAEGFSKTCSPQVFLGGSASIKCQLIEPYSLTQLPNLGGRRHHIKLFIASDFKMYYEPSLEALIALNGTEVVIVRQGEVVGRLTINEVAPRGWNLHTCWSDWSAANIVESFKVLEDFTLTALNLEDRISLQSQYLQPSSNPLALRDKKVENTGAGFTKARIPVPMPDVCKETFLDTINIAPFKESPHRFVFGKLQAQNTEGKLPAPLNTLETVRPSYAFTERVKDSKVSRDNFTFRLRKKPPTEKIRPSTCLKKSASISQPTDPELHASSARVLRHFSNVTGSAFFSTLPNKSPSSRPSGDSRRWRLVLARPQAQILGMHPQLRADIRVNLPAHIMPNRL